MSRSRKTSKRQSGGRSKAQTHRKANRWMLAAFISTVAAVVGAIALSDVWSAGPREGALTSPEQVQRIQPAEAKALLDKGMALLYDTRSAEAYRAKHASGAQSFPEAEQETLVGDLPPDRALIFY